MLRAARPQAELQGCASLQPCRTLTALQFHPHVQTSHADVVMETIGQAACSATLNSERRAAGWHTSAGWLAVVDREDTDRGLDAPDSADLLPLAACAMVLSRFFSQRPALEGFRVGELCPVLPPGDASGLQVHWTAGKVSTVRLEIC